MLPPSIAMFFRKLWRSILPTGTRTFVQRLTRQRGSSQVTLPSSYLLGDVHSKSTPTPEKPSTTPCPVEPRAVTAQLLLWRRVRKNRWEGRHPDVPSDVLDASDDFKLRENDDGYLSLYLADSVEDGRQIAAAY